MTEKISLSSEELQKKLEEHLNFLEKSAKDFDEGDYAEAQRMASSLRILLNDAGRNHALLKTLGVLDSIYFYDCAFDYNPGLLKVFHSLISVGMLSRRYSPLYDSRGTQKKIPFNEYWNKPIFHDKNDNIFSRKDIIDYVANQDGGAHVDPRITKAYYELSRGNSLGWTGRDGEEEFVIDGAEQAAIRQITHEVLKTFREDTYKAKVTADIMISGSSIFPRVDRNDPCPCGKINTYNGKIIKYKKCHGK